MMRQAPDYNSFTQFQVELDGFRVHYVDVGEGAPVVLVHGSPLSSFSFRHQIAALCSRFRVIAPDLPGFGQSDKPAEGAPFQLQAEVLRGFLEHLGLDSFRLLLHDWGGPIGAAAVADRLDEVQQLVLVNTTLRGDFQPPLYWRPFIAPGIADLLVVRLNLFSMGLPLMMRAARAQSVRDHYKRALKGIGTRRTILALERLEGYAEIMERAEVAVRTLSIPTLLLWGHPDEYFRRRELAWLKDVFPHADVYEIPHGGHFPQEDAPEVMSEALMAFLR
jgi:haloalkane dehalogenase